MNITPNLSTRCDEILSWRKTGIYEGDALQDLGDRLEAEGAPIVHSPIRTAEEVTIKEALELVADLADRRPDLGATSPEPSLFDIVFQYYQPNFGTKEASIMTDAYFAALMDDPV